MHVAQFPLSVNIQGELIDRTGRVVATPCEGFEDIFENIRNMDTDDAFDFIPMKGDSIHPSFDGEGIFEPNIDDDDIWDEEDDEDNGLF
jgi:hypothetical protein